MRELFHKFSAAISVAVGSPYAFVVAVAAIIIWWSLGKTFNYSDTWQLVINTATTIITFLMVFLIQNTQNRDAKAIHLKLDELLRAMKTADTSLVNLEEFTDDELEEIHKHFETLGANAAPHSVHALGKRIRAVRTARTGKNGSE